MHHFQEVLLALWGPAEGGERKAREVSTPIKKTIRAMPVSDHDTSISVIFASVQPREIT